MQFVTEFAQHGSFSYELLYELCGAEQSIYVHTDWTIVNSIRRGLVRSTLTHQNLLEAFNLFPEEIPLIIPSLLLPIYRIPNALLLPTFSIDKDEPEHFVLSSVTVENHLDKFDLAKHGVFVTNLELIDTPLKSESWKKLSHQIWIEKESFTLSRIRKVFVPFPSYAPFEFNYIVQKHIFS
jgi:hypothetical protein